LIIGLIWSVLKEISGWKAGRWLILADAIRLNHWVSAGFDSLDIDLTQFFDVAHNIF
jgi:hypothetical protein